MSANATAPLPDGTLPSGAAPPAAAAPEAAAPEAAAPADTPIVTMLKAPLTHLDVLCYRFKVTSPPRDDPLTGDARGPLWLFTATSDPSKTAARVCVQREYGKLGQLCALLVSKEAAMKPLGFLESAIQVSKPRRAGQEGGSGKVEKKVIISEMEAAFVKQRDASARRAAELSASAGASTAQADELLPYPLTEEQARQLLRDANRDGRAPGVLHELQLSRGLSSEGNAKLSQLASVCVRLKAPPAGEAVVHECAKIEDGKLPVLPELVVSRAELTSLIVLTYEGTDKERTTTVSSLKPPAEVLLWTLFCHRSSSVWALEFNETEKEGMDLTMNKSADAPTSSRALCAFHFNALRADPEMIVNAAVRVLTRVGKDEYEGVIIPREHAVSDESLTAFLTQTAKNINGVSEDCILKCISNRSGPISKPLANYASESGQAAGRTPDTFCSSTPGIERAMQLVIMYNLIEHAGGIQEGGHGLLWTVLLKVEDRFTGNPDPDEKPSEAPARKSAAKKGGGDSKKNMKDKKKVKEEDGSEDSSDEDGGYREACEAIKRGQPTEREVKLSKVSAAIAGLGQVRTRDGGLDEEDETRLQKLQKVEKELRAAEIDDLLK